jgi:hypothetical protein
MLVANEGDGRGGEGAAAAAVAAGAGAGAGRGGRGGIKVVVVRRQILSLQFTMAWRQRDMGVAWYGKRLVLPRS